jgi:hypothetical protein
MHRALNRPVLWETTILALLCIVDTFFTVLLVRLGVAVEANPLLAPFAAAGIGEFVMVKTIFFVPPLAILECLRPFRPRFVQFCLRAGIVGYLLVYAIGEIGVHHLH